MIVSVLFGLYNTLHSWLKMHYQEWRTELTESRIAETEKLVTDTDQQPLEGVNVTITSTVRASLFTGLTDANGAYSIEVTPEEGATYSIKFEKEGYKPQVLENVNLDDVQNVVMELDNVTGISTIATEGGKVQYVNVMGQVSDQPFQGVNIVLRDGKAIGKAIY